MSNKLKLLESLSDARRVLWIFGLYHGKQFPKYPTFAIRCGITVVITALFPILVLTKIILWKTEFAIVAKQLSALFALSWILMRLFIYFGLLPKQRALEDLLRNDIFNRQNQQQEGFVSAIKAKQKYLIYGYFPVNIMAVAFFALPPIVNNRFANIPIWTPFNSDIEDMAIYLYENSYLILQSVLYPTMDCIFIGFTCIVTAQIQMLKDNLVHITDRDPREGCTMQERRIRERLWTCIVHHNAILDLTRKIEDLFSASLFCQIVFGAMEICFCGLQLLTETSRGELLFWWVAFLGITGELMVSCWFGQEIITESSGIIEACYMSEWYTCTPPTRKIFFIIMEQTKRPITLNGGYFFTLSYATFLKVLRSAYSYYAVFSQVYQR